MTKRIKKCPIIQQRIWDKRMETPSLRWMKWLFEWRFQNSLQAMLAICGTDEAIEMNTDGVWQLVTAEDLQRIAIEKAIAGQLLSEPIHNSNGSFTHWWRVHDRYAAKPVWKRVTDSEYHSNYLYRMKRESMVQLRYKDGQESNGIPLFYDIQHLGDAVFSAGSDPTVNGDEQAYGIVRLHSVRWDIESTRMLGNFQVFEYRGHLLYWHDKPLKELYPLFQRIRILPKPK